MIGGRGRGHDHDHDHDHDHGHVHVHARDAIVSWRCLHAMMVACVVAGLTVDLDPERMIVSHLLHLAALMVAVDCRGRCHDVDPGTCRI